MGARAAAGAVYIGAAQAVKITVTLLSTIVIARLLSPHDYGVVAMITPVVAFLQVFQSLGLNQAIIQRPRVTTEQFNAMFWMNLAASTAIAAALLALSPVVGFFYHEPAAARLCAAMSGTVLVTGATLQHSALLNRNLKFKTLSLIDMAVNAATFAGTALAALWLRNYWALWLGPFIGAAINVVLLWAAQPWRPGLKSDFKGSRDMLRFGRHIITAQFVALLGRNLDNVMIARVWGPGEVGLYDRAYKLMMFPLQNISNPLARMIVPILSRTREDPERYRRAALGAIRFVLLAVLPAIAVAVASTDRLVPLLLGERWTQATPIFFWLSLAGMTQLLMQPTSWLFISCGESKAYMRWSMFVSLTSIAAFASGLAWKATGVAAAFCLTDYLIRTPVTLWWIGRLTPVRATDLAVLFCPFIVNVAVLWLVDRALTPIMPVIPQLAIEAVVSYGLCTALQFASATGQRDMRRLVELALERLRRRRLAPV